ncbi:MAG: OmpA family protein [Myxococcota bacterium]
MSWRSALWLAVGLAWLGPTIAPAAPSDHTEDSETASPAGDGRPVGASAQARDRVVTFTDPTLSKRTDRPWVQRWAPERHMLELGVFGGIIIPARDLELFEPNPNLPSQGFLPLATVAPSLGLRLGYYPLRFLGVEAEGAYMPTTTLDAGYSARLWALRGHVIGQLPVASIAPFVVFGAGVFGVQGNEVVLGRDVDPAIHLGIGTKVFISRRVVARLDLRDQISPRRGDGGGATNSIEVLVGLSIPLGRERDHDPLPEPPAPACEPAPAEDHDGDGFLDAEDRCPAEPGVAPEGCPAPEDRDADGVVDEDDVCPDQPGIAPEGCPDPDADADGILVPDDRCPDQPETANGFEDTDGCPDQVPEAVERFNGRLDGINFDLGKATLTRSSAPVLDLAVSVLKEFPSVRIEISGHTDNRGRREINMRLSQRRAEAVKAYLVERGVDEGRIVTRGAGPDEPIDSNSTGDGRANNRRIEFRVLE